MDHGGYRERSLSTSSYCQSDVLVNFVTRKKGNKDISLWEEASDYSENRLKRMSQG